MEAIVVIWEKINNKDNITINDIHLLGYLYGKDVEYLFENRILKDDIMKTVFSRRFHIPKDNFVIPDIEISDKKESISTTNEESVTKKRKTKKPDSEKPKKKTKLSDGSST